MSLRRDHANFMSHCWLPDERCVAGTEGGEIILIENFEFRTVIYPCGNEGEDLIPILAITPTSRGFAIGSAHGELRAFERNDENKEMYTLEGLYVLPNETRNIVSLATGLDDTIVCLTESQQMFSCPLYISNMLAKDRTPALFDHLLTPFHSVSTGVDSSVIAIDAAIWRPILASVGKDKSVRVWNLQERRCEIIQKFEDVPVGVCLSPSGLYLLVAFIDKLKVMAVLLNELSLIRDISIRQCEVVQVSTGGHFIAASTGSSVDIFDFATGDALVSLKGHSSKIKSIQWLHFDSRYLLAFLSLFFSYLCCVI